MIIPFLDAMIMIQLHIKCPFQHKEAPCQNNTSGNNNPCETLSHEGVKQAVQ